MNDYRKVTARPHVESYVWALGVVWTVIVAASLVWNVVQINHNTLEAACIQARAAYEKDIIYRRWNAGHGGVYVPVTEMTQPNPYLSDIQERVITTPSGKRLTLINPAYMTRQVHRLAEEEHGIHGHITSLNPIRPENGPDPWETKALRTFERGETEISSIEEMEGEEYIRLMRPLVTEKGCLKCHAAQGYREGDIRGGISVSVPMEPFEDIAHMCMLAFGLGHVLLWLMGLSGIALGMQRLIRSERKRKEAEEALEKYSEQLEQRVSERTDELRESEEKYRTIIENIEDGYYEVDLAGNLTFFNDSMCKIGGYPKNELMGMNYLQYADEETAEKICQNYNKIYATGKPTKGLEWRVIRKDGSEGHMEISVSLINDKEGKPIGFRGIARDTTERKRTEEALRETNEFLKNILNSSSSISIISTDIEGNVLFWNKGAENILGYKAEEIVGCQKIGILYHDDETKKAVKGIRSLLSRNKRGTSIEIKETTKDGRSIWMSLNLTPRFDEEGHIIGILGIGENISRRKQAEEAIQKAHDELEIKVEERTTNLKEKTEKLERMNRLFVDRELRMKELKEDIKELKRKMQEEG